MLQLDKHDDPLGEEGEGSAPAAFSIPPESIIRLAQGWGSMHTLDLYNITPDEMPEAVRALHECVLCMMALCQAGSYGHADAMSSASHHVDATTPPHPTTRRPCAS